MKKTVGMILMLAILAACNNSAEGDNINQDSLNQNSLDNRDVNNRNTTVYDSMQQATKDTGIKRVDTVPR